MRVVDLLHRLWAQAVKVMMHHPRGNNKHITSVLPMRQGIMLHPSKTTTSTHLTEAGRMTDQGHSRRKRILEEACRFKTSLKEIGEEKAPCLWVI